MRPLLGLLIFSACRAGTTAVPTDLQEVSPPRPHTLAFRERRVAVDSWLAAPAVAEPGVADDLAGLEGLARVEPWAPSPSADASAATGLLFLPERPPATYARRFAVLIEGPRSWCLCQARLLAAMGGIGVWVGEDVEVAVLVHARAMLRHRFGLDAAQIGWMAKGTRAFTAAPVAADTATPAAEGLAFAVFLQGATPVFSSLVNAGCPLYLDGVFHGEEIATFQRQCQELRSRVSHLEVSAPLLSRRERLQRLLSFLEAALAGSLPREQVLSLSHTCAAGVPLRVRVRTRSAEHARRALAAALLALDEALADTALEPALDDFADSLRGLGLDQVLVNAGHDVTLAIGPPITYAAWTAGPGGYREGLAPVIELRDQALVGRTGVGEVLRAAVRMPSVEAAAALAERLIAEPWSHAAERVAAAPGAEAWVLTGSAWSGTWHPLPASSESP